jgi:hypothetical protein
MIRAGVDRYRHTWGSERWVPLLVAPLLGGVVYGAIQEEAPPFLRIVLWLIVLAGGIPALGALISTSVTVDDAGAVRVRSRFAGLPWQDQRFGPGGDQRGGARSPSRVLGPEPRQQSSGFEPTPLPADAAPRGWHSEARDDLGWLDRRAGIATGARRGMRGQPGRGAVSSGSRPRDSVTSGAGSRRSRARRTPTSHRGRCARHRPG